VDSTGPRVVPDFNGPCGGQADTLRVIASGPAIDRLLDIVGLRERLPRGELRVLDQRKQRPPPK
jgi:hypothetical protein